LIGDEEGVLESDDIRADNIGDPVSSDDGTLPNGDADQIGVIDEDGTNRNDIDDADVDLDGDEEELQIGKALAWGVHTRMAAVRMGRVGENLAR
jgi:hypothetical protein